MGEARRNLMNTEVEEAEQDLAIAVWRLEGLTSTQNVIDILEQMIDLLLDKPGRHHA
jgi:hypothetical protein